MAAGFDDIRRLDLAAAGYAPSNGNGNGGGSGTDTRERSESSGGSRASVSGADTHPGGARHPSAAAGPSKKRGKDDDDGEKKPKKTRQTQSCDACRARKVKCDRPPPGTAADDLPTKDVCSHCRQLGMACTFEYKPKKRGPPNMYLKRMQAMNQVPEGPGGHDADPGPGPGTLASKSSLHRSQGSGGSIPRGRETVDDWVPTLARTVAAHKRNEQLASGNNSFSLSSSFLSQGASPPSERTSYNFGYDRDSRDAHNAGPLPHGGGHDPYAQLHAPPAINPLDAVIPRPVLIHIVDLYFDYVYCLIPCLHKPSFLHDLHSHREEQPGQDEWVALVFAVVEATLVQMPQSFVSLPRREIKILFSRVNSLVKSFLDQDFHTLTVTRMIILYFHAIATHSMGNPLAGDTIFGASYLLALRLHLHEESSYQNLNPVERELRKRIFWLMYGGDKTIAAIDGAPVMFHETDCADVTLPSPLDDEYVTEEGYLEQPEGHTPILAGFYYISKLFRLLGQVLDKRRSDRNKPPSGILLQMRINELEQIFHQVIALMDNCPDALKLDMSGTPGTRMELLDERWDAHVSADLRQLLLDPTKANRAVVKDGFLVQQANIYVTQQMVRYIVLQYREELGLLQDKELQLDDSELPGAISRRRASLARRPGFTDEDKDQIANDLLTVLSKIRMEVVAINSVALVAKVRYVASTLLDALQTISDTPQQPHNDPMHATDRSSRAQAYLWDFLRILSDIEALYLADDDD